MKFELRSQSPYNLTRCAMIFSQFPLDGTDVWIPAREILPAQYRRLYVVADEPILAIVQQDQDSRLIVVTHPPHLKHRAALQSLVAWQFHLDAPLRAFYRRARMHPFFQPILKTIHGVKPLRTPTLYEMGVIAITADVLVAVGTPVTRRPPHRSVLEELPHTALALGNNAKAN